MKRAILILTFATATMVTSANDSKYFETMARNIQQVYTAQTSDEIQQAVNILDRVGSAEKTRWEPYYYASFGYIMLANREKDSAKKDAYLDQAQIEIDKALTINPNESEIVALQGFIHMIRLSVDPASRGQKYSPLAMQFLGKAAAINPENPRALAMMAQMQLGTARFFNSPVTEACATNSRAIEKFSSYKPENPLAPVWGKGMTEDMLKQCK
ncbi:hypothetical protein BH10BAC4_BH10BAC4_09440 [soil metagenome]